MKLERADVDFPLWRKKVDASLLKEAATPIPKWLCKVWSIDQTFDNCFSKKDPNSIVKIVFNNQNFPGNVVQIKKKGMFRLFFDKKLGDILKDVYLMSYMRSIENELRAGKLEYAGQDIEDEIPFWEFLDIEFDNVSRMFRFRAHYVQKPAYVELFKELVKSHTLKIIEDLLASNDNFRFVKQDWKARSELSNQIEARNVIYNLVDSKNKLIYIGEAESLRQRLNQNRESINDWDFYRFDCLPDGLSKVQRVAIERLLIRTFASFFSNKKGIPSMQVSEFSLANDKIDL